MADIAAAPARHRRHFAHDGSLTALVAFEALSIFVVGPLIGVHDLARHVLVFTFSLVIIAGVFAVSRDTRAGIALIAIGVAIVPLQAAGFYWQEPWATVVYMILFMAFFVLLSWLILVHVFRRTRINLHCILGAIAVYLHIGLVFAVLYTLLSRSLPDAFSFTEALAEGHQGLFSRLMYFSFTSLTSVGYGDITPVAPLARSLANLEALCGQLFPAILLARLVSMEVEGGRPA
jgi:hypothetical protein